MSEQFPLLLREEPDLGKISNLKVEDPTLKLVAAAPKRRWCSFSLRTLFVLMTTVACFVAWVTWNANLVHQRDAARAEFLREDWDLFTDPDSTLRVSWIRSLLGDSPVELLCPGWLPPAHDLTAARQCFPEARLSSINDPYRAEDEYLWLLASPKCREYFIEFSKWNKNGRGPPPLLPPRGT